MKILLDFYAKVGREDIFKPTTANQSLLGTSNDNGIRVIKKMLLPDYMALQPRRQPSSYLLL
jgi:hypothetical protein